MEETRIISCRRRKVKGSLMIKYGLMNIVLEADQNLVTMGLIHAV